MHLRVEDLFLYFWSFEEEGGWRRREGIFEYNVMLKSWLGGWGVGGGLGVL